MRPSSYNIIVSLPDSEKKLIFHGYTGAVDLVQAHVAEILRCRNLPSSRSRAGVAETTLRALKDRGYFTDKSREQETAYATELGKRVHRIMRKHASPGVLVVPSYSCNLRCSYCYEKHLRGKGKAWLAKRMTREQAEAMFQAVDTLGKGTAAPRSLTLYGGEPFQPGNDRIIRFLLQRALEKKFQAFSAVTNGVELDRFRDLLGPRGKIGFLQITLDGPREVHDRRRFLAGGQGTFQRITSNISLALEQGVRVSVRMNVDRTNADTVRELHTFFQEQGWDQTRLFQAYCSPVHAGERSAGDGSCFASHMEMQRNVERKLAGTGKDRTGAYFHVASLTHSIRKRILSHLEQRKGLPRWRTAFCGSNMSMYVFDPFGDIYPCWEVIGQPEHRIGTYGPGSLEREEEAVRAWHHRSVVVIARCRSCAYLFFCGGGCEAFALRETGRPDQPYCFDFPRHFQMAAVQAYRDWKNRTNPDAKAHRQTDASKIAPSLNNATFLPGKNSSVGSGNQLPKKVPA